MHTDTSTFGFPVELGAQFIHGRSKPNGAQNPVWSLAQQQAWRTVPYPSQGACLVPTPWFVGRARWALAMALGKQGWGVVWQWCV